jgi:hypothetical protein
MSSASSPSARSWPAPPITTSRPRFPKIVSSEPFWYARDWISRLDASVVVWIFCSRVSGWFGSAVCWMTMPWSPKITSSNSVCDVPAAVVIVWMVRPVVYVSAGMICAVAVSGLSP